ncbi:MAG: glycine cleavage system protein GcvH [Syntrophales bacterium]
MSKLNPKDRKYSKEHIWALDNKDGSVTAGITDYAQRMLTDIVYIELPEMGKKVKQGEVLAVLESVKSVSDVYAPVSGEVIEINQVLDEQPELINKDPFGEGWIVRLKMDDPGELGVIMDAAAYDTFIA